jgi:hypothetical protein
MSKTSARLLIFAVFLLTAANWFYARKSKAASQIAFGQSACKSYVPTEWGEYKGSSTGYGVAFQDNAGTLRFVTNVTCEGVPQVALEIRRGSPSH